MQQEQTRVLREIWARRAADLPLKSAAGAAVACLDRREGDRPRRRADPCRRRVRQPAEPEHEAPVRPDHRLWTCRRQGHAGSRHPAQRDRPGNALQHLRHSGTSTRSHRQPRQGRDGGSRQSVRAPENFISSPMARADTCLPKRSTSMPRMSRAGARSRASAAMQLLSVSPTKPTIRRPLQGLASPPRQPMAVRRTLRLSALAAISMLSQERRKIR